MKSARNKTLTIESLIGKKEELLSQVLMDEENFDIEKITNKIIKGDTLELIKKLPDAFVDLLITDPPYNLTKQYNDKSFNRRNDDDYEEWIESWVKEIPRIMKPNGSLYICGDLEKGIHTHYIHVVIWGKDAWKHYIDMRDYLNTHEEKAKEYSELKIRLARKYSGDREA